MLIIINIVCDVKLIWFLATALFCPFSNMIHIHILLRLSVQDSISVIMFFFQSHWVFFSFFLPSNMKTILMNSRKSGANFGNELQNIDNNEMAELNINFSIIWSSSRPIELNFCFGHKKKLVGMNKNNVTDVFKVMKNPFHYRLDDVMLITWYLGNWVDWRSKSPLRISEYCRMLTSIKSFFFSIRIIHVSESG